MSQPYLDKYVVHNSSLSCFLLTLFVQQYELEEPKSSPDLLKLKLVLPFAWDEVCRADLCRRNTRSAIDAVLRDTPQLKIDLQERVMSRAAVTIQGLNLAVSTNLLSMTHGEDGLPVFHKTSERWPIGTKSALPKGMTQTVSRLATWYAKIDTPTLLTLLFGIPNEISH